MFTKAENFSIYGGNFTLITGDTGSQAVLQEKKFEQGMIASDSGISLIRLNYPTQPYPCSETTYFLGQCLIPPCAPTYQSAMKALE